LPVAEVATVFVSAMRQCTSARLARAGPMPCTATSASTTRAVRAHAGGLARTRASSTTPAARSRLSCAREAAHFVRLRERAQPLLGRAGRRAVCAPLARHGKRFYESRGTVAAMFARLYPCLAPAT
jgi:hypothetical protein